jgi:hypothetical protein
VICVGDALEGGACLGEGVGEIGSCGRVVDEPMVGSV